VTDAKELVEALKTPCYIPKSSSAIAKNEVPSELKARQIVGQPAGPGFAKGRDADPWSDHCQGVRHPLRDRDSRRHFSDSYRRSGHRGWILRDRHYWIVFFLKFGWGSDRFDHLPS